MDFDFEEFLNSKRTQREKRMVYNKAFDPAFALLPPLDNSMIKVRQQNTSTPKRGQASNLWI